MKLYIYRVIQEERSSSCGDDSVGLCEKNFHINTCLIQTEVYETRDLTLLDFCLWGLMKVEVYKRKVDTRDELLVRILDAAARLKIR